MEGKPKRLRPWLESLINSQEIPGLQWENEEHSLFRIPWKHRGKHDWSPENSRIFMEWAKQTGRYREGIDPPDYPAWKTRLRCAFNKAPDIEEVKEKSRLDSDYPYRVYRLKPVVKTDNSRPPTRSPVNCSPHRMMKPYIKHETRRDFTSQMSSHSRKFSHMKMKNAGNVRDCEGQQSCYISPPDFSSEHQPCYFKTEVQCNGAGYGEPLSQAHDGLATHNGGSIDPGPIGGNRIKLEIESAPNHSVVPQTDETGNDLVVKILYCGKEVLERVVRSPSGCRICYGSCSMSPFGQLGHCTDLVESMYGPTQAETVLLPSCVGKMTSEKQQKLGEQLLERGLQRGVILSSNDNNIYAYRLCQSAVFYSSQPGTGGKPLKLRRGELTPNEMTKLFDYRDLYIPALKDYLDGLGPKPDPRCYLVFGQEVSMSDIDSSVLIVATVAVKAALHDLEKAEAQMSLRTPKMEVSNSTELDHLARTLMGLCQPLTGNDPNHMVQYSPETENHSVPSSVANSAWYSPQSTTHTSSDSQQSS